MQAVLGMRPQFGVDSAEGTLPDVLVGVGSSALDPFKRPFLRHRTPDCQPVAAIDPALALLEIDRIRRQVPVNDVAAIEMEIEPLLSNRRGTEDEGPERRVECFADRGLAALAR